MEPNDVIERYEEVKEQVDQMDEEEVSALAERVAALASAIDDPPDAIARRVVSFFEQEKISPEVRILGIRTLTANMAGKLVSEKLARLLYNDTNKMPQSFWEQDDDSGLIMEIDVCSDLEKLMAYAERTELSGRVRKAAKKKIARIAKINAARIADEDEKGERNSLV